MMSSRRHPNNWYQMDYEQQKAWEKNDREHQDALYEAQSRVESAERDAESTRHRMRTELRETHQEYEALAFDNWHLKRFIEQRGLQADYKEWLETAEGA